MKNTKHDIESRRFYTELYNHLTNNLQSINTKLQLKKIIYDFSIICLVKYKIQMKKKYRKMVIKELEEEIKREKRFKFQSLGVIK